jgi:hypothetical protein
VSAPDERAELARRYLAEVSAVGVEQLPPTVLMREVAELRRLLASVLAIIGDQAAALDEDQAATVMAALDDASEGIRERAAWCPACRAHPAALCDEDADRLTRAEAYDHLAAQLRKATP